ncbi:MAG: radical SAM protein [Promethearchaeota archaeon]|nr:MAG: radical SAM protein [Candidatus Lokiarchaeota archaeon]
MKILLINPSGHDSKYKKHPVINFTAIPLGLAYVAATLEEDGHDVKALDAACFQLTPEESKKWIKKFNPDLVGIQAFTPSVNYAVDFADAVKEVCPHTKVMLGGPHPTFMPEQTLGYSRSVDVCLRGEGEYTSVRLANALEKGLDLKEIKGISFRNNGSVINTPDAPLIEDLDALPFPARHLFPVEHYRFFGSRFKGASFISSRGCPFQCSFCSEAALFRHRWRPRSAQNVVDEMEYVQNRWKKSIIGFMDDCFALSKKRVWEICDEMKARKVDCAWGCAMRVDIPDFNMLNKMAHHGCGMIYFGVESGSQGILNNVKKGTSVEQTRNVFKWCRQLGIDTIASLAFGFPGETKRSVMETIQFVIDLKPSFVVFASATPYPGTPFFEHALDSCLIKEVPQDWSRFTLVDPVLELTQISKDELKMILFYAYRKFHMRIQYLIDRLWFEVNLGLKLYGPFQTAITMADAVLPWLRWMKKYGVMAQLLPKDPLDEKEYFHRLYFAKKKRKEEEKQRKKAEKLKKREERN